MNYLKIGFKIFSLLLVFPVSLCGQEKGLDYQTILSSNPSVAGSEGNGVLHFSYLNFYPGNNFNLNNFRISYDGYFPGIHGGAGVCISNNYLGGIVNEIIGSFSYSYYFRAGRETYISSGLSASFQRRGYSFSGMILPDQIDPLLGSVLPSVQTPADVSKTVFDISAGTMIFHKQILGGISVSHLTQPDLSVSGSYESVISRALLLYFAGDFNLSGSGMIRIQPAGKVEIMRNIIAAGAGASVGTKYLALSSGIFLNNFKQLDLQAGMTFKIKDVKLFYAYRFNISGSQKILPVSLLHVTGISISLNNVDKRKTVKTINFPEM